MEEGIQEFEIKCLKRKFWILNKECKTNEFVHSMHGCHPLWTPGSGDRKNHVESVKEWMSNSTSDQSFHAGLLAITKDRSNGGVLLTTAALVVFFCQLAPVKV